MTLRLALLFLALAAPAHLLNGPKWPTPTVSYFVNPSNADLSESAVIAAVQTGASAWASAQSGANIQPTYAGTTTGNVLSRNFKNEIFFRDSSGGSLYGETQWWYDGNYHLIDFDVLFHDAYARFFSGSSGCTDGVYLEDAIAHEFGHGLGFGHSEVEGATMLHWMPYCATNVRTLHEDDIAGLKILYPPVTTPPPPPPQPPPIPIPPPTAGLVLTARGYKVKGLQKVDLLWSGVTTTLVDIYRNGTRVSTTANDGQHTDGINLRGGGIYVYIVCEAATTTCSIPVTVTF